MQHALRLTHRMGWVLAFCLFTTWVRGQTTIGIQGFETAPATPTLAFTTGGTGGTRFDYTTGSTAASNARPTNSPKYSEGSRGFGLINGVRRLDFSPVNTTNFSNPSLEFRLASFSNNSSGNGADLGDSISVQLSTNGVTFSNELRVGGNTNACWGFTDGTGIASVAYDGDNTPTIFAPAGGALRTTDGYSTVRVTGLPATATLYVRILMRNNDNNEEWVVDRVIVQGTASTAPTLSSTPGGLTLTYAEGSGPANGQFTLAGSNLTASGSDGTIGSNSANVLVSTDNATFAQSVPFGYASPSFSQTVYVRLVAGLTANANYNATLTSTAGTGGPSVTTAITASVTAPPPTDCGTNTDIATVRAGIPAQSSFTGTTVTVQGTVTATFGNNKFYVQDGTGGLAIFTTNVVSTNAIAPGDVVQVTGRRVRFNGEAQLDQVSCVAKKGTAVVPAPVVFDAQNTGGVTLNAFLSTNEGSLVRINGVNFAGGGTFTVSGSGTNYPFTACSNEPGEVRVDATSGLVGSSVPTTTSRVTGVVGRFINASATADKFQTFPRTAADVSTDGIAACSTENTTCGVPSVSTSEATLDVVTWNVEWLGNPNSNLGPSNKTLQQTNAETVVKGIGADVFMLQEISSYNAANPTDNATAFGKLIAALNGQFPGRNYTGECSPRYSYSTVASPDPNGQRVCIVYRQDQITKVSSAPLLTDFNTSTYDTFWPADPGDPSKFWSSGRFPFLFVGDVTLNGATQRVHFVGLHAKAQTDTAAYNRRRLDVRALYDLLATQYPNANIIQAGDHNDDTDLSIAGGGRITSYAPYVYANPLETAVNGTRPNPNFTNLTRKFSDLGTCASTTSFTDFIDHFFVSNEIRTPAASGSGSAGTGLVQYVDNSVQVVKPAITSYASTTSDHYPVYAQFSVLAPSAFLFSPFGATVTQGKTATGVTVGALSNPANLPPNATVTASGASNGVSVTNIQVNPTTGILTADVTAACDATNATFTLTLNNSGTSPAPTGTLNVTVEAFSLTATILAGNTEICGSGPVFMQFNGTPNATIVYSVTGMENQTIQLNEVGQGSRVFEVSATTTFGLVNVSDGVCTKPLSASTTVTVLPKPSASIAISSNAVCVGETALVTFTGTPNATVTYNAYLNGQPDGTDLILQLDANGTASFTTPPLGTNDNRSYWLTKATLNNCSQFYSLTSVYVNRKPLPTAEISGGNTVCEGQSASIQFNGTSGATVTYTINGGAPQTALLNGGLFTLNTGPLSANTTYALVSASLDGCSQNLSGSTTVSVTPAPTASIGGGGTACVGTPVNVTFTGTPNATVTYTVNGGGNQTIQLDGTGAASLAATASATYALVSVTNGTCSQAQSGSVSVTLSPAPTVGIGGSTAICQGGSATVTFTGTANATVTYTVNGGGNQTIQLDGTGAASLAATATATYALVSVALNGCSQPVSGSATVTVSSTLSVNATATPNPVCEGGTLTLQAQASGSTGPLTYAWTGPNGFQAGTATATRTVGPNDGGVYQVTVTDASQCQATASTPAVTVHERVRLQAMTPSQAICAGTDFTLSATATGSNLTYQWYRSLGPTSAQAIAGATSASLTVNLTTPAAYYVVVTGPCNALTSPVANLTFKAPTILRTTGNPSAVCEGGDLTLSASATGPGSLSFSWRKDDPNGAVIATGPSLTIDNARLADAGTYYVSVTSGCTTQTAALPVQVRYVRITGQPAASVNLCGGTATLTVQVQAVGVVPTYQWKRNGQNVFGATKASLTVSSMLPGTYTVEVRSVCGGAVTSEPSVVGCSAGRLAAEAEAAPRLEVSPNPVRGVDIRCRVTGLDQPSFQLISAGGRSLPLSSQADDTPGAFVLRSAQPLPAGLYVLQAREGRQQLTQRILVMD